MEHYFITFVSCAFYALVGVIIMLAASLIFSTAILVISDIYDKVLTNLGKGRRKRLAFLENKHEKLVDILANIDDDYTDWQNAFRNICTVIYEESPRCH